jgi:two-component system CheB/CheR fusion protein
MGQPVPGPASGFRIVCLGGSTGALQAYVDILERVPADSGMAFVIVSHREVGHGHLLAEVLSPYTDMPVVDVDDGMRVVPNHVFIAPPQTEMTFNAELFHVAPLRDPKGWPTTISTFLQSLAANAGSRTIAVILSGKDFDGSSAMSTVRAAGGINMAQSNARSPEMPASAVKTGYVDFYLPSVEIAKQLLKVVRS